MQLIDGSPVYSASDLVGFLECEHLTALERAALAGHVPRPVHDDPELDVLRRRGEQHERRYLDVLRSEGREVLEIVRDGSTQDHGAELRGAAEETLTAMAAGADVIYQATFFDGQWRGHADFLLRVDRPERPSRWGGHHYEVADTKLARHVKAGAVLQICTYIDMLTELQGVEPDWLHVVLGGSAGGRRTLRVADFMAYYRAARRRFDDAVAPHATPAAYPPPDTYPDPVEHCEVCRWRLDCEARRRADDHLSLVAGISRRQRQGLMRNGIVTLKALGERDVSALPRLDGTSAASLTRVHEQARIQLAGRREDRALYELLLPAAGDPIPSELGLASLPLPSPGDLFFDIEGDPYAADAGLEYLFGVMDLDGTWHATWSTDAAGSFGAEGEKRAFEAVMDLFAARLWQYPDAHIYHFAPYEPTAMKQLMGRYATREDEVDRFLRGGALVDLHRVVRQSLRASVMSYGLKDLERLYGFTRSVDLRDAGSSIVAFEQWLELEEGDRPGADHLERIEGYNRDDVESTRRLRDWLEERRPELASLTGLPVPRPGPRQPEPTQALSDRQERVAALAGRLTDGVPEDGRSPDQQARWLLAQLLSWHRREDKSVWWLYYHLLGMTDAERIEASQPLAGLEHIGVAGQVKRSLVHRYRFPDQEYDVRVDHAVRDPATQRDLGKVVAIDEAGRTIDLKRGANSTAPHPTSLIPFDRYETEVLEDALMRLGDWAADHDLEADGPYQAAYDLLLRRPPRLGQVTGASLRVPGEADLEAARRLALALDRSTLAIQGPPGSGKTYSGAHMALDLVRQGRRIGITANSHRVVGNFLAQLIKAAEAVGLELAIIQKVTDTDDGFAHRSVQMTIDNDEVLRALRSGSVSVAAGTPWLWARDDMSGAVDVLFVDEAGQMSLANVLASAGAAASLVLLGDPQQLDQPLQGAHPPGADRSGLAHLLGDAPTMPDAQGLFLETTWRLHPDLCSFTSEVFYESRLEPELRLLGQELRGPWPTSGTGPRLVTVDHEGNENESLEEADVVARLARDLVEGGASWVDAEGRVHPVDWSQIVIVAAYNAQVGAIARAVPQARVGTVDKFQGQEAPISIYSMASSSADEAPRGMGFLYNGHRFNVATSRARCVAVVVASPRLLRVRARTPDQMRLANALARFAELSPP